MITPESINEGLRIFYLTIALFAVALAIVIYPTLRERSKTASRRK